jgi:cytochrome c oxidase cbb3-type subunit 4
MDVNQLRIGVTVLSFVAFLAIWAWAWSRKNQSGFDEAAQLPFVDSVNDKDLPS